MIKDLAKCMKPYKVTFILAVITVILESMMEVSLPFLMNVLITNRSIYKIVGEKTNSFEYNDFAN